MKKNQKNQAAAKGCMKISQFFTKKIDNSCSAVPFSKSNIKRKLNSPIDQTPTKIRKLEEFTSELSPPIRPSTSGKLKIVKSPIRVKSNRELLSPDIFQEISTPTKLNSPSNRTTPTKKSNSPVNGLKSKTSKNDGEKTPKKRTPNKKLFDKSPSNIGDFDVQIIDKFVKITPSKCMNKIILDAEDVQILSAEKRQSSLLKFLSPTSSKCSLDAKSKNEQTPTKKSAINSQENSVSRVKTKLDFSFAPADKENEMSSILDKNRTENKENNANISNFEYNFDDSWDGSSVFLDYSLDFSKPCACKIIEIKRVATEMVLTVESLPQLDISTKSARGIVRLGGNWINLTLNVGDSVYITATKSPENDWIINNSSGLLVYEPDLLISSTSIVRSIFCKRRSIFAEKFRGFESSNKHMIVGNVVHQLLQAALKTKARTTQQVSTIAKNLLKPKRILNDIFTAGLTVSEIEAEVLQFVPKTVEFMETYLLSRSMINSSKKRKKDCWEGFIKDIDDIEENIWCKGLGIKGKIDVTIRNDENQIMPLELKTGRAQVYLEHQAQIILYVMMLNNLNIKAPSGLLLYLREMIMKELSVTIHEERDIMLLRNELAYFMTREVDIKGVSVQPAELPEPINHRGCNTCPYSAICSAYSRYTNEDLSNKNYLKEIEDECRNYLSDKHVKYFIHWSCLLAVEGSAQIEKKNVKDIYTLSPTQREANGTAVINLTVESVGIDCNGVYEHVLRKKDDTEFNFLACGLAKHKYIVISTNDRIAVASGFVSDINTESIALNLDRNLNKKYSGQLFHIDTYESTSVQSFNMASLATILENSQRVSQLRKLIIDKEPPRFDEKLPKIIVTKGASILARLNRVQKRAVLRSLAAKDYLLIKGMPGTGKTATVVALIQLLLELGKTILITSHTHSAVDNVCLKLIQYNVNFMRLGSENRLHPDLVPYSEHTLIQNCTTTEQLDEVYNKPSIFGVTCLGSGHPILSKRSIDICIVDESTQVLQSSILRPLSTAKTFILIGDPDQLPALVKSKEAIARGMAVSMFERLMTPESTIALNLNYRMNERITYLANVLTYNGDLLVANDEVAKATLTLNKENLENVDPWLVPILDTSLEQSVQLIDTNPVWNLNHSVPWFTTNSSQSSNNSNFSYTNIYEAILIYKIVSTFIKADVKSNRIGVIATYRDQVLLLSRLLKSLKVDVSTVDQFQGKDKNVVIYSCSKSVDTSKDRDLQLELLEDRKRLNVAITRAKNKLILIGDVNTLKMYSTFQKILPSISENIITVKEGVDGFSWSKVFETEIN